MQFLDRLSVIAAVNRDRVLERDLMASPMIASGGITPYLVRGAPCIGAAYCEGIHATTGEYMIFAHQDVYFPKGWHLRLEAAIRHLEEAGHAWAVLGCFGVSAEGKRAGRAWSSGLGKELKPDILLPMQVCSLDEMVLVVRRESGLQFDPDLPHFHLYGTDIVQMAADAGYGSYVIDAPVVHNSDQLFRLDEGYHRAYRYMYDKWRDRLPVRTLTGPISTDMKRVRRNSRQAMKRYLVASLFTRSGPNRGVDDPGAIARRLDYEALDADN